MVAPSQNHPKKVPQPLAAPLPSELGWPESPLRIRKPHHSPLNGVMPVDRFWRPEEIPHFTGQKKKRRTFVVTSDRVRREITGAVNEINQLKEKQQSSKVFTYQSGDIQAFFDDSDNESDASSDSDFRPSFLNSQPWGYLLLALSSAPNALSNIPAAREWIYQSKKFPEVLPLPAALHELCKAVLTVPRDIIAPLLPADEMPVSKLSKVKMASVQLVSGQPLLWFDPIFPVDSVDTAAPIPPQEVVDVLMVAFGQALLDGKQSIRDPFTPGKLLLLWTLKFWEELHRVRAIKNKWSKAVSWLGSRMSGDGIQTFRHARIQLDRLSWNKPIVGSAASGLQTSLKLTRLLSSEWLSDTIVDMMVECLAVRLRDAHPNVALADTSFSHTIQTAADRSNHTNDRLPLKQLSEFYDGKRCLYAPVHLSTHLHFVAFQIDFTDKSFHYGDSLGLKQDVSEFTKKVQRWLERVFGQTFRDDGLTLPCAQQLDLSSCGLLPSSTTYSEHPSVSRTLCWSEQDGLPRWQNVRPQYASMVRLLHPQTPSPVHLLRRCPWMCRQHIIMKAHISNCRHGTGRPNF